MFLITLLVSVIVIWSALAFVGVQKGLQRKVVVYRNWADFAQTVILVSCFVVGYVFIWVQLIRLQIVLILITIGSLPWFYTTKQTNQRARDLWVVVPAKISLIVLAAFCSYIAFDCTVTALSPKTENRSRLINGAIAASASTAAWGLFRIIQRLITDARTSIVAHETDRIQRLPKSLAPQRPPQQDSLRPQC